MLTRKMLRAAVITLGCAATVFVFGGCATGGTTKVDRGAPYGGTVTKNQREELYKIQRAPYNGYYYKTPADDGRLWHWGI